MEPRIGWLVRTKKRLIFSNQNYRAETNECSKALIKKIVQLLSQHAK